MREGLKSLVRRVGVGLVGLALAVAGTLAVAGAPAHAADAGCVGQPTGIHIIMSSNIVTDSFDGASVRQASNYTPLSQGESCSYISGWHSNACYYYRYEFVNGPLAGQRTGWTEICSSEQHMWNHPASDWAGVAAVVQQLANLGQARGDFYTFY